ncbi:hypothetical protein KFK09_010686 [Dendrobium nobile]|uniref:Uncharacterized protein n=1 Tax=Dendrobium nobile TaxID=94219 RepID=A0A8T3BAP4_DENNO|nr:hypothetical protein KFK09_010686 [Dendrobium nobile]
MEGMLGPPAQRGGRYGPNRGGEDYSTAGFMGDARQSILKIIQINFSKEGREEACLTISGEEDRIEAEGRPTLGSLIGGRLVMQGGIRWHLKLGKEGKVVGWTHGHGRGNQKGDMGKEVWATAG